MVVKKQQCGSGAGPGECAEGRYKERTSARRECGRRSGKGEHEFGDIERDTRSGANTDGVHRHHSRGGVVYGVVVVRRHMEDVGI